MDEWAGRGGIEINTEELYNITHGPFYIDVNGRTFSYLRIVQTRYSANPIEDILIPEDKMRFDTEYEKNKGAKCPTYEKR